ncbi:MAG: hypothetical protein LKJ29_07960 [Lactobacillus sp.]|jgi:hypothetical protein|uniref:Uncharacterized protein n=1 Tax=Lacticaseibacillus suilingensis TaxID=2799577 RepID=A0ABW4BET3_9LACO|nr:hypothetical protein [Lacticaseibacillus suilingensis]MCI1894098.1 hypothetical protein [Lactobacillus sp.]MCI1918352.1 hypothetical protein [Lactobacillus sp.]MCI1941969.1 hypothetical protein [Lactobacillus sp.]MCI1972424.1 hypothetical protein [Lactobacillus sp.]MCI2036961.1 hypothetical protein [Lactobacillus sp.]
MTGDQEKLLIIAALIGLSHSFATGSPQAQTFATRSKALITTIADAKYQGVKLYTAVLPLRRAIADAISMEHLALTAPQQQDWEDFKHATQQAYDDYWKSISTLQTLAF